MTAAACTPWDPRFRRRIVLVVRSSRHGKTKLPDCRCRVGEESEIAKNDGQLTYFKWKDRDGEDVVDLTGGHPHTSASFSWRDASGRASRRLLAHGKTFCQRTDRHIQPRTLHRRGDCERAGAGFSGCGARNYRRG